VAMQALRKKTRGAKYSKTVWLGLTLAAAGFLEAQFRMVEHLIPEEYRGVALMGVGMLVVVLRFLTTMPVEDLAPEPETPTADNDP
jgi:hypothetical protein